MENTTNYVRNRVEVKVKSPVKMMAFKDLSLNWNVAGGNHPLGHATALGTVIVRYHSKNSTSSPLLE